MAAKAVQLRVSGRVQGVGYRASTWAKAQALGLSGWVRNCPDGRVEAFAQGDAGAVEALIAWAKRGPLPAKVESVEVVDVAADSSLTSFEIRK